MASRSRLPSHKHISTDTGGIGVARLVLGGQGPGLPPLPDCFVPALLGPGLHLLRIVFFSLIVLLVSGLPTPSGGFVLVLLGPGLYLLRIVFFS